MLYVKDELLSISGIGKQWKFICFDGSTRTGILNSLSPDGVIYSPSPEKSISMSWNHIDLMEAISQPQNDSNSACTRWWKEKSNLVNETHFRQIFSLIFQYRSLFDALLQYHTTPLMELILSAKNNRVFRSLYFADSTEMNTCLTEMNRLLSLHSATPEECAAARSLIYLIGKDYISGLNELLPMVVSLKPECAELMLPLACFYHEIKDGTGCFYWLMHYFNLKYPMVRENSELWWGYLKYAIAFDYLPQVWQQIERLYETNSILALQSAAFLFFLQGNHHKGAFLYYASLSTPVALSSEELHTFYTALTYHSVMEDWGSHFYRYYLRVNQILEEGTYRNYIEDQNLSGYVYDFVESRGYCMVLGMDLISYFLHFDYVAQERDNFTPAIRRKLRQEMNVLNSVQEELPVRVSFCRDCEIGPGKRTYAVTHAELDILSHT